MALCPILAIAGALWVRVGGSGEDPCVCVGSRCQWWPKCRHENQCPKCGTTCEKHSSLIWECPEHGRFDWAGEFVRPVT